MGDAADFEDMYGSEPSFGGFDEIGWDDDDENDDDPEE